MNKLLPQTNSEAIYGGETVYMFSFLPPITEKCFDKVISVYGGEKGCDLSLNED